VVHSVATTSAAHSVAATSAAHSAVVAPAQDTPPSLLFLAGSRIYTACRCDAGVSEIPRFERRPVRVRGATGYWAALEANYSPIGGRGRVCHSNVPL
jgi:hypothetical protein